VPAGVRLLNDPQGEGSRNMARDAALAAALESEPWRGPVLRLYGWERATLSLGHHQDAAEVVDGPAAARLGVVVVRRPTGGRAVLHADELTYAFAAPIEGRFATLGGTCETIAAALVRAYRALGLAAVPSTLAPPRAYALPRGRAACFAATGRHELAFAGRKLAASAQKRGRRAFLQHGSLPLSLDYDLIEALTGSDVRGSAVALNEIVACPVSAAELAAAVGAGFAAELAAELVASRMDELEDELAAALRPACEVSLGTSPAPAGRAC